MTGFKLDTSGEVATLAGSETALNHYTWDRLPPFTQGYVEALFNSFEGRFPKDGFIGPEYGFHHLAHETLALIVEDCEWLQSFSATRFDQADGRQWWADRQAGKELAKPLTPYIGDDGKVYLKETT